MSTIANAKVEHNYNCYNGYFFGCLRFKLLIHINSYDIIQNNISTVLFGHIQYILQFLHESF